MGAIISGAIGSAIRPAIGPVSAVPDIAKTDNPDLIVMYTMDNISGSTLVDESPNNNDGTITGATSTPGHIGNALNFTGHDDEVTMPSISRVYTNGATQSAWVKFEGHNTVMDFIIDDQDAAGASASTRATLRWRPNLIPVAWEMDGGNGTGFYGVIFEDTLPSDGTWMFMVWKVQSDGTFILKRDDSVLSGDLFFGTQVSPTTTSETMRLAGPKFTNTDRSLIGELDQYRYFDRITTDVEDTELYNGGVGV